MDDFHWLVGKFYRGRSGSAHARGIDLGITLFDAADTYGNGLSEELIAKAFPNQRDEIVIATKVGYDFVHHGQARGAVSAKYRRILLRKQSHARRTRR